MKQDIKVPNMGESIAQAVVAEILKASGSKVSRDEELLELETDKVNQVIYAPEAGTIQWEVSQGDKVSIGQRLGFVDSASLPEQSTAGVPSAAKQKLIQAADSEQKEAPKAITPSEASEDKEGVRRFKEAFVDDVRAHDEALKSSLPERSSLPKELSQSAEGSSHGDAKAAAPKAASSAGEGRERRQKLTKIRQVIAERMLQAVRETAMLTTVNEADMSAIMALRDSYKESFAKQHGIKLGLTSFFVKAAVSALKAFPVVNSYLDGDELVFRNYYDIGIAVASERGLIVPVLRSCDLLTMADIERSLENYVGKARSGGLKVDDLQGGGFTITNGGIYGSLLSTPLINPPQVAILGLHKIMKRPVVVDDAVAIRPMMYLALSYDHRILDGKEAVSFLVHIKNCLEEPARLLLEV